MFVTIMKTARISDLRRGHRTTGFVPELRVGSFLRNDSADCTIVTIERPSADRLSACPYIYVRSTRTRVRALQSLHGLLYQEPPRLWSRLKFWRTTGLRASAFRSKANSNLLKHLEATVCGQAATAMSEKKPLPRCGNITHSLLFRARAASRPSSVPGFAEMERQPLASPGV